MNAYEKRRQNLLLILWRKSENHTEDQQGICLEYLAYQKFLINIGVYKNAQTQIRN